MCINALRSDRRYNNLPITHRTNRVQMCDNTRYSMHFCQCSGEIANFYSVSASLGRLGWLDQLPPFLTHHVSPLFSAFLLFCSLVFLSFIVAIPSLLRKLVLYVCHNFLKQLQCNIHSMLTTPPKRNSTAITTTTTSRKVTTKLGNCNWIVDPKNEWN